LIKALVSIIVLGKGVVHQQILKKEERSVVKNILLMKLTDQGAKDIKNAPQRIEQAFKTLEKMGGKIIGFYVVTGKYDYIAIGEAPSDEVGMTFVMGLSSLGNVRTTTARAYTREEFAEMVKKLP
jgi:uncharacterized protein with GYD domain